MGCNEVKNIIEQVMNREIPESSMCDVMNHIENCESCREHLESMRAVSSMLNCCKDVEPIHEDVFSKFENQLDTGNVRVSVWEIISGHPYAKPALVAGLVLVAVVVGGFTAYNSNLNASTRFADRKIDASLTKMPDGAVMMKTMDGHEIIFLDPALEADGKLDDVLKELEEVLKTNEEVVAEDFSYASTQ